MRYKWQIKGYNHLKVTEKGVIYNTRTNRVKKLCLNGYSKGVWVTSRIFLTNPNSQLELIKNVPENDFEKQLKKYLNKTI